MSSDSSTCFMLLVLQHSDVLNHLYSLENLISTASKCVPEVGE
jgi:hypothetical protein